MIRNVFGQITLQYSMENGLKESLEKFGEISLWAIENPTIAISTEGNVVLAMHMKKKI